MQSAIIIITIRLARVAKRMQAFTFEMIMCSVDNWINIWSEVYLFGLMVLFYADFSCRYISLTLSHVHTTQQGSYCLKSSYGFSPIFVHIILLMLNVQNAQLVQRFPDIKMFSGHRAIVRSCRHTHAHTDTHTLIHCTLNDCENGIVPNGFLSTT